MINTYARKKRQISHRDHCTVSISALLVDEVQTVRSLSRNLIIKDRTGSRAQGNVDRQSICSFSKVIEFQILPFPTVAQVSTLETTRICWNIHI